MIKSLNKQSFMDSNYIPITKIMKIMLPAENYKTSIIVKIKKNSAVPRLSTHHLVLPIFPRTIQLLIDQFHHKIVTVERLIIMIYQLDNHHGLDFLMLVQWGIKFKMNQKNYLDHSNLS